MAASERSQLQYVRVCGLLHGCASELHLEAAQGGALSSAKVEYATASYACREVAFVRNVLVGLGFPLMHPTVVCVDNRAAIEIAHNIGVTSRNKHFVDAIHYFRHLVDHRIVIPTHVLTKHQRADGFTKCLGKSPFKEWLRMLLSAASFDDVS